MEKLLSTNKPSGFLTGQVLLAMPNLKKSRFARSVIYVCAHSEDGALGIVLNQPKNFAFSELLYQLDILTSAQVELLPQKLRDLKVREGGPVEPGRGFVLHSIDYATPNTMPVNENLGLTTTIDILRAIGAGVGPKDILVALGYAGWQEGQLDAEIKANAWLTCSITLEELFSSDVDNIYERCFSKLGIVPALLVSDAGHA